MCLTKVTRRFRIKKRQGKIGYKIFKKYCHDSNSPLYGKYHGGPYKVGEWYSDDSEDELGTNHGGKYTTGFHIYVNKKTALKKAYAEHEVYKVEYLDVVAEGTEGISRTKVVVARCMKILEKVS